MKTLKSFILVSFLLSVSGAAYACGPWFYSANASDIYRILPYGAEGPALQLNPDFRKKNILLWSKQTGCKDTAAIRQALYNGTLTDWEKVYENKVNVTGKSFDGNKRYSEWVYTNAFFSTLGYSSSTPQSHVDSEAILIIYWSKLYESIRNGQRSPWYYNSGIETDEKKQLRELYNKVQQYKPTKKYADRYRFLAMKCSWALEDDSATIALWERTKKDLKGSIFYSEAEDYASRSLYRMGREDEANRIYLRRGDIGSLMQLEHYNLPELLNVLLRIAPDSPVLTVELQRMLFSIENNPFALKYKICIDGYCDDTAVLRIAQRAAKTTIRSRRAMWNYTAACLLDYQRRPEEALRQLDGIDSLLCDKFLKNSIRVLRFYLRSKTDSISDEFEQYAIGELKWMDMELQYEWKRMPERERYKLSRVDGNAIGDMHRSCYMHDAMRRILLPDSVGLCQRLAESGRKTRALQMANMAENRFFMLTGNKIVQQLRIRDTTVRNTWEWDHDEHPGFKSYWYCWREPDTNKKSGWWASSYYNAHDYRNWMFLLADRMSALDIEEYRQRQLHPKDADDRWFNARGYTNSDYWQDIIGTHYLRECNYPAAVAHLKYVSPKYQQRMNVTFDYDPFGYKELEYTDDSTGCKLHFAQRMVELQKKMLHGDRDSRGMAMLEYSFGMRNSFDLCWELTTYGHTNWEPDFEECRREDYWPHSVEEWQTDIDPIGRLSAFNYPYKKKYTRYADYLQRKALATIKSDEVKAEAYSRLGMISKVVKEYTKTKTAQHYALVCDQWKQYRIGNNSHSSQTPNRIPFKDVDPYNSHNGLLSFFSLFAPITSINLEGQDFQIETGAQTIILSKIERTCFRTTLYKKVIPHGSDTWINSSKKEFIEDAETGRKYYLLSSSVAISPSITTLSSSGTIEIVETYPVLENNINRIRVHSGNTYYTPPYSPSDTDIILQYPLALI